MRTPVKAASTVRSPPTSTSFHGAAMSRTTTGGGTGQARGVVLGYGRQGGGYVAMASANAAPADRAWYRNRQEHPIATVEVGAERFEVRASTANSGERDQLAAAVPWFESQQKLTSRQIPIVLLTRA